MKHPFKLLHHHPNTSTKKLNPVCVLHDVTCRMELELEQTSEQR
eukprot:CAMPEP_0196754770 /NCGR_PEP_ID=MMETSP1091-20130531/95088_1 /TAXON_ID=302021 /ORGANISM="Rhodomonas sp., Strain CCMP768" /LENGTH=43 /DNA_ID= /DNA_START= /DNA_END= /DNA_ORIENTATION=